MTLLYGKDANGNQVPLLVSANGTVQTSGLWPGTSSQLTAGDGSAVTVGSGLTLAGGTLSASGGSETVFDVNFAALSDSTQTLSNGNVVIGGVTYTIQNAANAGTIQFVNGSGFVISGKNVGATSSEWGFAGFGNQRTAPVVLLPFQSITSKIATVASRFRAFAYVTSQSFASGDTILSLCVDNIGSAGATMFSVAGSIGWLGVTPGQRAIASEYVLGGSQSFANVANNVGVSTNVIGVEVDSALPTVYCVYYGQWAAGWPSLNTMSNQSGYRQISSSTNTITQRAKAIGMAFNGATGGAATTVSRLRVDVW